MILKQISISNFMSVESAEINLEDRGLVGIKGINKDEAGANSVGAGKSTIVDAICWGLFGNIPSKNSANVNRRDSKDPTGVTIELLGENGKTYTIVRTFKRSHHLNFYEDGVDLTSSSRGLTQHKIDKVIGMDFQSFVSSNYLAQENMPDIPGMGDKALKELIEKVADLEKIREAENNLRSEYERLLRHAAITEHDLKTEQSMLESVQDYLKAFQIDHISFEKTRNSNLKELEKEINDTKVKIANINVPQIESDLKETESLIATFVEMGSKDDEQKDELRSMELSLGGLHGRLNVLATKRRHIQEAITKAKAHLDHLEKHEAGTCPTCGQTMPKESVERALLDAGIEIEIFNRNLEENKIAIAKEFADSKSIEAAIEKLKSNIETASSSEKAKDFGELIVKRDWLLAIYNAEKKLQADLALHQKNFLETTAETNPFDKQVNNFVDKLHQSKRSVEVKKKENSILNQEVEDFKVALEVLGRKGVRAHLLDEITPFLNERTAYYMGILTDGLLTATWNTIDTNVKGEEIERFNIKIDGADFDNLSGGEKRKVRLACAFALQDLAASRADNPIKFMIADEIDYALDAASMERLFVILNERAKERGTLLVISHNNLEDYVDNIWTVTKENKVSTLSES